LSLWNAAKLRSERSALDHGGRPEIMVVKITLSAQRSLWRAE
jgi:hypothetical protein